MVKKKLKILGIKTLCTVLLSSIWITVPALATTYSATGNISWYDGEGRIGYDGKVLTGQDCATKLSVDNPPGGTPIYVTDLSNGSKGTFYKYDVGNFPSGVILDLTYRGFVVYFGYPQGKGYFYGSYYHY